MNQSRSVAYYWCEQSTRFRCHREGRVTGEASFADYGKESVSPPPAFASTTGLPLRLLVVASFASREFVDPTA